MPQLPDLVFIRHKVTGHAYPLAVSAVDPAVHDVLVDEPARLVGGQPRPPIYDYPAPEAKPVDADNKPPTKPATNTNTAAKPKEK